MKKLLEVFVKKNCKKLKKNLEKFRIEKVTLKNCILHGKDLIIHLIVVLIKTTLYKKSQYFPKPFRSFGGNINVKVDLSNYATKTDLKNVTHVDTSNFELKNKFS